MMLLLLAALLPFLSGGETARELSHPEEYVNILGGSDSRYDLSHGSTLPLITLPWGFNTYAPQTNDDGDGWWFHPSDRRLFGLRVTHQPSPWISDYGNFLMQGYMPVDAATVSSADQFTGYSPQSHSTQFYPYLFETTLLAYSTATETTRMQFAPTLHGGVLRLQFPRFDPSAVGFSQVRRVALSLNGGRDQSSVGKCPADGTVMLSGFTTANSGGVGSEEASAFKHFFAACVYGGEEGVAPLAVDEALGAQADAVTVWANFRPEEPLHQTLTVRFATSFISVEQAQLSLQREAGTDRSFEQVASDAKAAWNEVLSRVKVTAVDSASSATASASAPAPSAPASAESQAYSPSEASALLTTFYSSLYRASLFPRLLSEVDASGVEVHWSPYAASLEQRVMAGPLSVDSGFWDAWNTVYALSQLSNPQVPIQASI
jgi:putative alpha-1,2-mannosidase